MRQVTFVILVAGVWLIKSTAAVEAGVPPHSTSTSHQFIVYGPDAPLRGALCNVGERTKATALSLLCARDAWQTPIVVNARYPQANLPELPSARLNFNQTGSGLKLQLDLSIAADVSALAVERELLRAIYLEMMYRQQPDLPAGTAFAEPPEWLLDGTLMLASGRDLSKTAEPLRTAATLGRLMSLQEFLHQRPALLESPSRTVYRAYAAALVAILSKAPGGPMSLARFVTDLPHSSNDPLTDLQKHFPFLGDSSETMEKNWSYAVAHWTPSDALRMLDCAATEHRLAEILQLKIGDGEHQTADYSLEEFPKFIALPGAAEALKNFTRELLVLSGRANPLYIPIILQYEKIATLLGRRKTRRIAERLAEARADREQISRTMAGIGDYLNWYEATQSRTVSGAFRDYLKAAELALEEKPRRHDPISVYLNAVESQLQP